MDDNAKDAFKLYIEQIKKAQAHNPDDVFIGIQFTEKHYLKAMRGNDLCNILIDALEREMKK